MVMAAIEQYIAQIQGMCTDEKLYDQMADYVRKSIPTVLTNNAANVDLALQSLELSQHSAGLLGALCVKLNAECVLDTTLALVQEFLLGFNVDQIRPLSDAFCDLCHRYTTLLVQKKQYTTGIYVLSKAIIMLRSGSSQLLSIHSDLYQLCLLAKNFKPALQFLDVDITDIAKEGDGFDAKYFLLYYYYGGMIYAALRNLSRALYFFEVVLTTPAQTVSQIMAEAYKKYLLISLILHGKFNALPKYTSQIVNRYIKSMCSAYTDLSHAYATRNPEKVREVMTKHQALYQREKHFGLAKQVLNSIYKRNIQRLTKTFLTLSLADVANRCDLNGSAEAEKYLISMIEDGEIFATIDKRDGMVYFQDNPEKFDQPDVLASISDSLDESFAVNQNVEDLDSILCLNPQYVQRIVKQQGAASSWLHDDEGVAVGIGTSGNSVPEIYPAIANF